MLSDVAGKASNQNATGFSFASDCLRALHRRVVKQMCYNSGTELKMI